MVLVYDGKVLDVSCVSTNETPIVDSSDELIETHIIIKVG